MVSGVFTLELPVCRHTLRASRPRGSQPAARRAPFIAGPENGLARFAATALLDSETEFSPLLIYGPPGVGKTHLALGYAGLWKERRPSQFVAITDGADFARDFSVACDTRGLPDFRRRLTRCDLIVIDGIDALSPKKAAQAELVRLLDDAHRRQQSMIVTARQLPSANSGLLPAVCSRLLAGLMLPVRKEPARVRQR